MSEAFETGFWQTAQALEEEGLAVSRRQLPLLRLFYLSGRAFAVEKPEFESWRTSIAATAHRWRTKRS